MENIQIRRYCQDDYESVCLADIPLFNGMGGYVLFRHMSELFPSLFFVAETVGSKKIVGYILGGIHLDNGKKGKIVRIGVSRGYQRMGCGTELISRIISEMKKYEITSVHLTVAVDNNPAISFYKKCGFKKTSEDKKYLYLNTPRYIFEKEI
ncbi:MAG TPA: N-acetyltransferase [Methanocorpusculum sp.]|nr:N-acetyltransferase [Methanocorpusculum sp.]